LPKYRFFQSLHECRYQSLVVIYSVVILFDYFYTDDVDLEYALPEVGRL